MGNFIKKIWGCATTAIRKVMNKLKEKNLKDDNRPPWYEDDDYIEDDYCGICGGPCCIKTSNLYNDSIIKQSMTAETTE